MLFVDFQLVVEVVMLPECLRYSVQTSVSVCHDLGGLAAELSRNISDDSISLAEMNF